MCIRDSTYGLQKVGTYTYTRSYGDSADTIVLFGPYYGGLDESFTDAYLSNAVKMAKAAQCKLVVYARDAANVANLGKAMASAKLVLFDSHGTTDYYKQESFTSYPDYYYYCLLYTSALTDIIASGARILECACGPRCV